SYRIGELERSLLTFLNSTNTLAQVLKLLRKQRQYETLDEQHFLLTVEQLQRNGLIRSSRTLAGLGTVQQRQHRAAAARVQSWLAGFVSWQLRGLQPDAWLAKLAPHTNAMFSWTAVAFWLITAAVTCLAVLLEFPRLAAQASAWQWIVHPVQGSALFAVFVLTRGLHELGHALVCKRHGVRCPDIGLFVVLGAPCVYCDVSESWQLPSRWQRAAVAAAGMYVELIVATLAAWVWMLTIDGPANTVALQTMFVCSVSTVLINANPLMRFDGYYILSDILDESNLRGRADALADARLYHWILGRSVELSNVAGGAYENLLCLFSWLGWVYRAGLSLAIAGLLVSIYESWNLAWIGRTIAALILISWWGIPSVKLAKNLIQMAEKTNKRWRLALVTALFVGLVALLPIPYRQFGSGWVQPESMRGVYAPATGILEYSEDLPDSGEAVEADRLLFSLYDAEAVQEVIRARELSERAGGDFKSHQETQSQDTEWYRVAFDNAQKRWREATEELNKRELKSPRSGRFLAMPAPPPAGPWSLAADALQYNWDSATQAGRLIPKGTMLGAVCGSQMVAVIPLSDAQLEWVFSGTEIRLRCVERPSEVYRCKVDQVVPLQDANAAWRLMNGDMTEGSTPAANAGASNTGQVQAKAAAAYAAQLVLPPGVEFSVGAKVDGVFIAPSQTLGSIGYRWLKQNLRWLAD
ncbi:MAG: M50 family metallopeptidase, partial [Pirellulaceae bacterium]|nr:M50 family metallopeptidase [Pirellulaceae bacterium]